MKFIQIVYGSRMPPSSSQNRLALRHTNRLTVKHMQALVALDSFPSLTAAADGLGISQPALTARLREIERLTGARVFQRPHNRVMFTSVGMVLLNAARVILDELTQAEQQLMFSPGQERPTVRLAVRGYTLDRALSPMLAEIAADPARPIIEMAVETLRLPLESLLDGSVDLTIAMGCFTRHGVVLETLFDDFLVGVVPRDHPLARKPFLLPANFEGRPFVTTHAAIERAQEVELFFRPAGNVPRSIICLGSADYVCGMVAAGGGVSILSAWAVEQHAARAELALVPLTPNGLRTQWTVAYRREDRDDAACRMVIESLKRIGP